MITQVNTDKNIEGSARLEKYVDELLSGELEYYEDLITRVEVFLSDENGAKTGPDDKKCVMEARLRNKQPIAVTSHGGSIEIALSTGIDKLKAALATQKSRLESH